jgi:transposase
MTMYVGLDVHSKQSVFVVENEIGTVMARGEVPTSTEGMRRLRDEARLPAGTRVALETGTTAFFAARALARVRLTPVVVVDAHEVRIKAHRPRREGIRSGSYRAIVHVPPLEISRLRESLSRRRHFVRLASAEINAVQRLLRSEGLGALARSLTTAVGWDKLEQSLKPHDPMLCFYIRQHRGLWQLAREQIKQLEQLLEQQQLPFSQQLKALSEMQVPMSKYHSERYSFV